jgi:hypothetical protein
MLTSGRRRHERFSPAQPWNGSVAVMRDVIVQVDHDHENRLVAFGGAAGVVGEVMRLDLSGGGDVLALDVEVLGSRPVMLGGSVRHRVQLGVLEHAR